MKRGARCIARTIGMSDSKTCAKPKRVRKLVSAELAEPCPHFGHGSSSYWTPRPVTVKICTRRDMERTCPPKIRVCQPKPIPKTKVPVSFIAMAFLLKCAIVATLLYWMFTDGTLPFIPDIDKIDISRFENAKYSLIQKYNQAILKIMDVLVRVPRMVHRKVKSILGFRGKTSDDEEECDETSSEDD